MLICGDTRVPAAYEFEEKPRTWIMHTTNDNFFFKSTSAANFTGVVFLIKKGID